MGESKEWASPDASSKRGASETLKPAATKGGHLRRVLAVLGFISPLADSQAVPAQDGGGGRRMGIIKSDIFAQDLSVRHKLAAELPPEMGSRMYGINDATSLIKILESASFRSLEQRDKDRVISYSNASPWASDVTVSTRILRYFNYGIRSEDTGPSIEMTFSNMRPPAINFEDWMSDDQRQKELAKLEQYVENIRNGALVILMKVRKEMNYGGDEWIERALQILMKTVPRGTLLPELYTAALNNVEFRPILALLTKSQISHESLEQVEKEFIKQKASGAFFYSDYWIQLSPENQAVFLKKHILVDGKNDQFYLLASFMEIRGQIILTHPELYTELAQRIADKDPDLFLRLHCFESRAPIYWLQDKIFIQQALANSAVPPETKIVFLQYAKKEKALSPEIMELLIPLIPPPAAALLDDNEPHISTIPRGEREAKSIFDDPSLKRAEEVKREYLPAEIRILRAKEVAKWQVMIARNLFFRGFEGPITQEKIDEEVMRIKTARERFKDYPIFGDTLYVAHGELWPDGTPRFAPKTQVDHVRSEASATQIATPFRDYETGDYAVTVATLKKAREDVLGRIRTAPRNLTTHFTFFGNGHGDDSEGGALYLSDGDMVRGRARQSEKTVKILAKELVAAFKIRYQNSAVREAARSRPDVIVIHKCESGNSAQTIRMGFEKEGLPPPIIIVTSGYNQYGYSNYRDGYESDFVRRTILDTERLGARPTVGGAVAHSPNQVGSYPDIFAPDSEGVVIQIGSTGGSQTSSFA